MLPPCVESGYGILCKFDETGGLGAETVIAIDRAAATAAAVAGSDEGKLTICDREEDEDELEKLEDREELPELDAVLDDTLER